MKKNEILGTTAENLGKSVYLSVTDSVLEEIAKAIPIVSVLKAGCSAYQNVGVNRRAAQFFIFIEECESLEEGAILKIYKNKNNLEMGMEILNAIETSYLPIHAKMIAKLAILYDKTNIDRSTFIKFTHIIPKLSSYLLEQIEECYRLNKNEETRTRFRILGVNGDDLSLELQTYGFITVISGLSGSSTYKANDSLYFFYENIYKEE